MSRSKGQNTAMGSFREDARENRQHQLNTASGSASNASVFEILTESEISEILAGTSTGKTSSGTKITPKLQAELKAYRVTKASHAGGIPPTDSNPLSRNNEQKNSNPDGGPSQSPTSASNPESKAEVVDNTTLNDLKNKQKFNKQEYKKKTLRYPQIDIHKDTDYLQIEVLEYVPAGITKQKNVIKNGLDTARSNINKNKKILRTIQLPIPANISDTNSVGWGEDSINSLAAYALGASADVLKSENFLGGMVNMFKTGLDTMKGMSASGEAERLALNYFSSQAANVLGANTTFEGVMARSSGQILNPNKELLFNGVNLRSFNFSIPLAPRDKDESEEVMNIIRTFKESMVPKKSQTKTTKGLFLQTPNVFQLSYRTGSKQHKYLNSFIMAALTNMSVNYTGSGVYMTYGDEKKTPVHMVINLSFQELNPVYYEDYLDKRGQIGVGY